MQYMKPQKLTHFCIAEILYPLPNITPCPPAPQPLAAAILFSASMS